MKKAAVILNVVTDGTTYIATYESGKVVAASVETMPGTVKKWLETHTGAQEGAETETVEEMTGEEIAAAFEGVPVIDTDTGETITVNAAEAVISSQAIAEAHETGSSITPAEVTICNKKLVEIAEYASIPVNTESLRDIASEGVQAAGFAAVATIRLFTCIGLALSLVFRRAKALLSAWITTVFDWCVSAYQTGAELWNAAAELWTELANWIAPVFWGAVDAISKAWDFREELIKENC